jgi:PTS system galactitol-specific IIA component
VKKSALAVGTLAEPVAFHEMGSPERDIQAEIVFLMALNDPKDQVPCLKRMVSVFKNHEALETIKSAADPKQLAEYLKGLLLD